MRWTLAAVLLLALAPRPTEAAERVRVAVAKVRARGAAKPDKLESGIRAGVAAGGAQAIASSALAKSARDVGVKADSAEGARAAGADYLVKVKISVNKKKFTAEVELIRASDGEVVDSTQKTYAGKGALAAGKAIGRQLGKKAKDLGRPDVEVAVAPPPPKKTLLVEPPAEVEDEPPPPKTRTVEPKDDDEETSVKADVSTNGRRSGREDGYLRAQVSGGTQIGSAYTVVVGGESTGLAYSLKPLLNVGANVVARIPQVGLWFGVNFNLAPVEYAIDVDPPVDPSNPSGRFISAGGRIGYEVLNLDLSDSFRLRLSPMVGVAWNALSVESQGDNTIVMAWSAIDANGGLDLSMIIADSFVIGVEGRAGYVFSYSEKPKNTGQGGSGFDIVAGLSLRYWIIDLFGIYLDASYAFMRVGLSGEGTRVRFMEDAEIIDASIYSADAKLGLGVMFGI